MANPAPRFRILTVDDSEDILALLEVTLGKEYDVVSAMDGRAALKIAFGKPRPDLLLLDVDMPGSSGYDVCRAIKASPALADIPVIFLTQRNDARDVVQGFQLGAIDYFTKPINPPVLAARIRAHVELIIRRGQQDELIRTRTTQLEQTRLQLIRRLGRAMEYHETSAVGNRVVRLGHYARHLAEESGAQPELCDLIMKAAPLHDIGKLGVPAQILRKSEKLSSTATPAGTTICSRTRARPATSVRAATRSAYCSTGSGSRRTCSRRWRTASTCSSCQSCCAQPSSASARGWGNCAASPRGC